MSTEMKLTAEPNMKAGILEAVDVGVEDVVVVVVVVDNRETVEDELE